MIDGARVITDPTVYLVGRQTVGSGDLDRFLADHGVAWESDTVVAAEVLTETAGRVCYMSFAKPRPGGNEAYLTHIKESGHGSVLEHAVWSFVVTGVSRSLTHELVRHRAGFAYSQLSQRYVDESGTAFVVPHELREEVAAAAKLFRESWHCPAFDAEECDVLLRRDGLTAVERAGIQWLAAVAVSRLSYSRLTEYLEQKLKPVGVRKAETDPAYAEQLGGLIESNATERRRAARQAARSVLPNATETKVFVTANARALRHFLEQRGSAHAEPEIRKLAGKFLDVLQAEAPNLFGDYTRTLLPDGTCAIDTPHRKV